MSNIDDIEKRVSTLENHLRVAVMVAAVLGFTGGSFLSLLWSGFWSAKKEVDALGKTAQELDGRTVALKRDVDSNLAPAVEGAKGAIISFGKAQADQISGEVLSKLTKSLAATEWHEFTLQNGWSNYGNDYVRAAYCKDALGHVHLRGMVKGGTEHAILATLPSGYLPETSVNTIVWSNSSPSGKIGINQNSGAIFFEDSPNGASLDGIEFKAKSLGGS